MNVSSNYNLLHTIHGHLQNSSWETPSWSGKLSIGAIHDILYDETKYFKNLTRLVYDSTIGGFSSNQYTGPVYNWNTQKMTNLDTWLYNWYAGSNRHPTDNHNILDSKNYDNNKLNSDFFNEHRIMV